MVDLKNGAGLKKRRRTLKKKRIFPLILLLLVLIFAGGNIAKRFVVSLLVEIEPARVSSIEEVLATDFLLIRYEEVVTIPFGGVWKPFFQEGERIAKNTVVGFVEKTTGTSLENTEKVDIVSPQSGVLSFYVDGYESVCNPDDWQQLSMPEFNKLEVSLNKKPAGVIQAGNFIAAGGPLFKVVDNLKPVCLFAEFQKNQISEAQEELLQKKKAIKVRLDRNNGELRYGKIEDVYQSEDVYRILVSLPYCQEHNLIRRTDGEILLDMHNGVVIKKDTLLIGDEGYGVFLVDKGKVSYRKVEVLADVDNDVVIRGVAAGEMLILTPSLVEEGQAIFSLYE